MMADGLGIGQAGEQAGGEVEVTAVIRTPCGDDALHGGEVVVAEHMALPAVRA